MPNICSFAAIIIQHHTYYYKTHTAMTNCYFVDIEMVTIEEVLKEVTTAVISKSCEIVSESLYSVTRVQSNNGILCALCKEVSLQNNVYTSSYHLDSIVK
ncbi:hypothetical protein QTP88_014138 [Uroleucon formosanum]